MNVRGTALSPVPPKLGEHYVCLGGTFLVPGSHESGSRLPKCLLTPLLAGEMLSVSELQQEPRSRVILRPEFKRSFVESRGSGERIEGKRALARISKGKPSRVLQFRVCPPG